MGFKNVKEFYYLGVKIALRRLVASDFNFLLERVLGKLDTWGSKFISLAGRFTLARSTILSIPIFYCTHSLVPIGILAEIDKACREFIWHKENNEVGLHFVSWENLCKPLHLGGRGLHSCVQRVDSLRAKIAWKYVNEENSFLHKCLKPKYGNSCWLPDWKQNVSSAWKIIRSGAKALQPIIRWKISNGENVNVMEDVWILDKALCKWPTFLDNLQIYDLFVDHFIENGGWDMVKLHEAFRKDLLQIICNINIEQEAGRYQIELISHNSGKTLAALSFEARLNVSNGEEYWNWMKKIYLNPRTEVFWWRIYHKVIPTFQFLEYRRLKEGCLCLRGCLEIEDIKHVAVTCDKLIQILKILNQWGFQIHIFHTYAELISWLKYNAIKKTFITNVYCTVVFLCWKSRNRLIHEGMEDSNLNIASNALSMTSISISNRNKSGLWDVNQSSQLFNKSWHPPPPDWIKINVDASLLPSYKTGIGAVWPDHQGRFLFAFGKKGVHWDIARLELVAIFSLLGIIKDWITQYKGIIIEGDNENVIKSIQSNINKNGLQKPEIDVRFSSFVKEFNLVIFKYVSRESNKLADMCANYALNGDFAWDNLSMEHIPPLFFLLLKEESDAISLY
ncbi:hypothetical protein KFK09_026291 [Dendrobium nobile]|uniref:RNase H type-1 domain-containing protein n=1 Tax=Dendrobium nobile TaxID=94219 RepID=A0A8T3A665_DENNO|nr:hypothetical protein KFK09_026291 [Dendrobium nobile]